MKRLFSIFLGILGLLSLIPSSWADQESRSALTTLLPIEETVVSETGMDEPLPDSYLWVQQTPKRSISLRFDLRRLPVDFEKLKKCTLRVVAADPKYRGEQGNNEANTGGPEVKLKGWLPNPAETNPIGSFIVFFNGIGDDERKKEKITVAMGQGDALCDQIRKAINQQPEIEGKKPFTILLGTESDKAGALFYSKGNFGSDPSNRPRLVLEYTQRPPTLTESAGWPQHQQNPEHTGRSPWSPSQDPVGFSLEPISIPGEYGGVIDYPLIYRGNLYLLTQNQAGQNYVLSLDFKGKKRWSQGIAGGTVQRPPVISREGILYAMIGNQILAYDLPQLERQAQSGKPVSSAEVFASFPLTGKLASFTDLTMGNDGSLFLALKEGGVHYLYGFTSRLEPFLKSRALRGEGNVSTVTVSRDGRKIFAQASAGVARTAASREVGTAPEFADALGVDVTNPAEQLRIVLAKDKDRAREYVHIPLATTPDDYLIFSDFTSTANQGNIWGYKSSEWIWNDPGTLMPQPVLGSDGFVYYLNDGELKGHPYNQKGSGEIIFAGEKLTEKDKTLNCTSNLVLDGADNIYFWDNGRLRGYIKKTKSLVTADFAGKRLDKQREANPEDVTFGENVEKARRDSLGPEQFIRLLMGPDGTLWANNKNGSELFAFKPEFYSDNLSLPNEQIKVKQIKDQTVYRAKGTLTVGMVEWEQGAGALFQAGKEIHFSPGFTVPKGASLLCRTGF